MSDQSAAPDIIEDEIIDTGTEEFAHVVAMLVLLEPGMSYTHSVALSPDYGAGQIVQDVNSLKKRARRLLVPAMHEAAKRAGRSTTSRAAWCSTRQTACSPRPSSSAAGKS